MSWLDIYYAEDVNAYVQENLDGDYDRLGNNWHGVSGTYCRGGNEWSPGEVYYKGYGPFNDWDLEDNAWSAYYHERKEDNEALPPEWFAVFLEYDFLPCYLESLEG